MSKYEYSLGRRSKLLRKRNVGDHFDQWFWNDSVNDWMRVKITIYRWDMQTPITEEEALFIILSGISTHDFIETRSLSEV